MTTSAFIGRFLTEQKADRRSVTFIPVETIPAFARAWCLRGGHVAPNRFRHEYQTTYFYVSDLGLHLRQYAAKGADAYVSSLTNGKACPGSKSAGSMRRARRWRAGKAMATARLLRPNVPRTPAGDGEEGRADVADRPQGTRARPLPNSTSPACLRAGAPLCLQRPQPLPTGERFDVSVMARDADGRPAPAQPVQAVLRRADGKAQWTANLATRGKFSGYYRRQYRTAGRCRHRFVGSGAAFRPGGQGSRYGHALRRREFLPERMKLDLAASNEALATPAKGLSIDVTGRYLYGAAAVATACSA